MSRSFRTNCQSVPDSRRWCSVRSFRQQCKSVTKFRPDVREISNVYLPSVGQIFPQSQAVSGICPLARGDIFDISLTCDIYFWHQHVSAPVVRHNHEVDVEPQVCTPPYSMSLEISTHKSVLNSIIALLMLKLLCFAYYLKQSGFMFTCIQSTQSPNRSFQILPGPVGDEKQWKSCRRRHTVRT